MNKLITLIFALVIVNAQKLCYKGGCSGQLCSDQEGMISTCEWTARYACYQTAACEVQETGDCGWTMTPELGNCISFQDQTF